MLNVWLQRSVSSLVQRRFLNSLSDVALTQRETLFRILMASANTWFGKQHSFVAVKSIQDYQKAVPICSYADIAELVERCKSGERGILTKEVINYFHLTSGSTSGQQKLIPSTSLYQQKIWKAMLVSQGFLQQWITIQGIQGGQGLMLVSTLATGGSTGGTPYGPTSGNVAKTGHYLWRWLSVAPFEATQVYDSEARRYVHWRYALLAKKLFFISAPYTPSLLTFAATLLQRSDELIRDIADGTLSDNLLIPTTQRKALTMRLHPNRQRARQLEQIALRDGGLIPRAVWPELAYLLSVHAPSFSLYESRLADCYGHRFIWGLPYLASEGLAGIPWDANSYSHIPAVRTSFLEFIPEEEWSCAHPRTCLVTDLENGKRYDVVLTGWNGMYRYRLGDIIEIDGKFQGVPTFKVISRRDSVLSVLWEKTTEAQLVAAVEGCEAHCKVVFVDFVVDIDRTTIPARYQLWTELLKIDIDLALLEENFDIHLRQANPIYSLLRDNGEIGAPVVRVLPTGTFEKIRYQREGEGVSSEQIKILHAVPHWQYPNLLEQDTSL